MQQTDLHPQQRIQPIGGGCIRIVLAVRDIRPLAIGWGIACRYENAPNSRNFLTSIELQGYEVLD
ncbi:hypothetical protein LEM8419_03524 [Neolewinella maritima]|uniref:Uncharacterized protein n=1 Tax=Neolewinella maritima TaxID=1383882 RepID=A0ABM9B5J4_9BACT|nr:hypothetical protein [Neolewinella maritima]CAH1002652.1 hypothetical protein LEM8419_03524 [Neolewinella maritima]